MNGITHKVNRRIIIKSAAAACAAAVLGSTLTACALPGQPAAIKPAQGLIEMGPNGVNAPKTLTAGIAEITLSNKGQSPNSVMLARVRDGKTFEEFNTKFQSGSEDALELVSLVGGVEVAPGLSQTIVSDLKPGTHVAMVMGQDGPPQVATINVEARQGALPAEPKADATIELQDFAFVMPEELKAGPQVWQVTNKGKQWHETLVVKLNDGATIEDVMKSAEQMDQSAPQDAPPPFEQAAMIMPINEGERTWVNVDLKPGTYHVICFLPDLLGDGQSHLHHGMVKQIVVK